MRSDFLSLVDFSAASVETARARNRRRVEFMNLLYSAPSSNFVVWSRRRSRESKVLVLDSSFSIFLLVQSFANLFKDVLLQTCVVLAIFGLVLLWLLE